jgi:hypothetical protein
MVLVSSSVAGLGLLGCDVLVSSHRSEPVYVEQQQPAYVVVAEAPPAPRIVERRPPPPTQGHIWIDGYYSWSGRQYVWETGRWAVPPRANVVWIGPSYDRDQHGYRYTAGHWQPGDHQDSREPQKQDRQDSRDQQQDRR